MKSVLITGVYGGIGRATAELFADSGWNVMGIDSVEKEQTLELAGFWRGDVSSPDFWREVSISPLLSNGLDVLVNNAAIQICKSILETSSDEWDQVMAVNLKGSFLGIKFSAPLMTGRESAIINVSSVHALQTSNNIAAYAASKGGLVALTRAAAVELADKGIRVNAVLPGAIDTPMLDHGLGRGHLVSDEIVSMKEQLAAKTPCKKIGAAGEVASSIMFLADNRHASFITGQTLVVDGGASARLSTE